jgi:protein TonB
LQEHAVSGRASAFEPTTRLQTAMLLSLAFHAFVLFGVGFKIIAPRVIENSSPPLEVILVNTHSVSKPKKADALAQVDLEGGGSSDADRRVKSPLPSTETAPATVEPLPKAAEARIERPREKRAERTSRGRTQDAERAAGERQRQAEKRVVELEQEARQLLTQLNAAPPVAVAAEASRAPEQPEPAPDGATLVARSLAMARLEGEIAKDYDSYQKRPRRAQYDRANAKKYVFARYVDDWRTKVERVGNLNYPEAARRQQLFGSLLLTVSVRHDGSVEKIELKRSSGYKILDEAARRIVELAGPFAVFPDDMRKQVDILDITRTWTFTKDDQLVSAVSE